MSSDLRFMAPAPQHFDALVDWPGTVEGDTDAGDPDVAHKLVNSLLGAVTSTGIGATAFSCPQTTSNR